VHTAYCAYATDTADLDSGAVEAKTAEGITAMAITTTTTGRGKRW